MCAMPYTDLNFGKATPGYMAHCWFGRPLLLSNAVTRRLGKDKLVEAIDSALALGSDGFVFRLGAKLTDASFADQMALFDGIVQSYSQRAFIYVEVQAQGIERPLLDLLHRHTFPSGYMIASKNPATVRELYRLYPDSSLKIALMVGSEKDLSGLMHCPYSTVEITGALATHERILKIHSSMKEVFVRAKFGEEKRAGDDEDGEAVEKRVRWLMHEGVDAIISDRVELLSPLLDSKRTNAA